MLSMLGADQIGILQADWKQALSVAAMAAVLSLLTSVYGLPEINTTHKTIEPVE